LRVHPYLRWLDLGGCVALSAPQAVLIDRLAGNDRSAQALFLISLKTLGAALLGSRCIHAAAVMSLRDLSGELIAILVE
jgi:hypothetical protein